jgi:SAM-dependent methyltransferase
MREYIVPDHVTYLDAAAATGPGRDVKRRFIEALDLRTGDRVLDLGCGPGTDLLALASAVGDRGTVIGVDNDPVMVSRAEERINSVPSIEVRTGDAHLIPVRDRSMDRARTERVLQHVEDPSRVLAELHRVLRTGGLVGLAEPDWDSLVFDLPAVSPPVEAAFAAYIGGRVRNRSIGRRLPRLLATAGFEVSTVDASTVVFRDTATAEQILGLRRNVARAVSAGVLDDPAADGLLEHLEAGPVLACFVVWTVTAICRRT